MSSSNLPPERNPELYKILGLQHGAPAGDIKKAFRELALKHHPDKNVSGSPVSEGVETFKRVTEAYQYLCDEEKKASYDERFRPFRGTSGLEVRSSSRHVFGTRRYEAGEWNNTAPFASPAPTRFPSRGASTRNPCRSSSTGASATGSNRYTPEQEAYFKQRDRERGKELAKKVFEQRRREQQEELERIQREDEAKYGGRSAKPEPRAPVQMPGASSFKKTALSGSFHTPVARSMSASRLRRPSSTPASPVSTRDAVSPPCEDLMPPHAPQPEMSSSILSEGLTSPSCPSTPIHGNSDELALIVDEENEHRKQLMVRSFAANALLSCRAAAEGNWLLILGAERSERTGLDILAGRALQLLREERTQRALLSDYADMVVGKFRRLEQHRWDLLLISGHKEPAVRVELSTSAFNTLSVAHCLGSKVIGLLSNQERCRGALRASWAAERSRMNLEFGQVWGRALVEAAEIEARDGSLLEGWRRGWSWAWGLVADREARLRSANAALLAENGRLKKECSELHADLAQSAVAYGEEIKGLREEITFLREQQQRAAAQQQKGDTLLSLADAARRCRSPSASTASVPRWRETRTRPN